MDDKHLFVAFAVIFIPIGLYGYSLIEVREESVKNEAALIEQGFRFETTFASFPSQHAIQAICGDRESTLTDKNFNGIEAPSTGG